MFFFFWFIFRKYEPEVETKWEAPFLRGASGPPTGGYNPGGETKKYIPSETCKLVRDMEAGHEASYNPMTGAEKKPAPAQSKLVDYLDKKCGLADAEFVNWEINMLLRRPVFLMTLSFELLHLLIQQILNSLHFDQLEPLSFISLLTG